MNDIDAIRARLEGGFGDIEQAAEDVGTLLGELDEAEARADSALAELEAEA